MNATARVASLAARATTSSIASSSRGDAIVVRASSSSASARRLERRSGIAPLVVRRRRARRRDAALVRAAAKDDAGDDPARRAATQLEMDLVWDGSHPKYLQFAGGSSDESSSSDEDDDEDFAPPISDDFRGSSPAAFAAAAAASKQAATSRAASKYERRLGGTGGGVTYDDAVDDPNLEEPDTVVPGGAGYEWREKDPVWDIVTTLARKDAAAEPLLSSYMYMSILSHDTLEQAVSFVLANRLADSTLLPTQLMEIFNSVLFADDADGVFIRSALRRDIQAIRERDPACSSYVHALLYLKGFHALQAHRVQHALWKRGQRLLALTLQARISTVFAMDLHPAAKMGKGILIDHGTGVVIGETAVVGDNVSILQGVTLGGTGKDVGDRHPKIGKNVLIGAHSTILGNITVGKGAMIAAGSLVLKPVAPHVMVAGAPAKEVGRASSTAPALAMKQDLTANEPESRSGSGSGSGSGVGTREERGDAAAPAKEGGRSRGGGKSIADRMPDDLDCYI